MTEMTERELRVKIARMAGHNEASYDTVLTKGTLNSVYAYVTGEFACDPWALHRPASCDFEERSKVMWDVAIEFGLDDWFPDIEDTEERERVPDFSKANLETIYETLCETDDERDWV